MPSGNRGAGGLFVSGGPNSSVSHEDPHQSIEHDADFAGDGALSDGDAPVPAEGAKDDDGIVVFRPGPAPPASNMRQYPVRVLMEFLRKGEINLDAPYQRDVVWGRDRMIGLVTSVVERYYIPPVIFNVRKTIDEETGEEFYLRICVDGKQRLSSMKAFIDGKIACRDRDAKFWFVHPTSRHLTWFRRTDETGKVVKRRHVMQASAREAFLEASILCNEIHELRRDQEEELFARVQLGVSLNSAEKLKAAEGPWQKFATQFLRDFAPVWDLLRNMKRSKDWLLVLSCFSQVLEVGDSTSPFPVPTLQTNAAPIKKLLNNHKRLLEHDAVKAPFRRIFGRFNKLVTRHPQVFDDTHLTKIKTFAPIEMVSVCVLLHVYPDRRTGMLAGDVLVFRREIRKVLMDLRMNGQTWKTCWELIANMENYRGATDGSTRRQPGAEDDESETSADEHNSSSSDHDDPEDDDDPELPDLPDLPDSRDDDDDDDDDDLNDQDSSDDESAAPSSSEPSVPRTGIFDEHNLPFPPRTRPPPEIKEEEDQEEDETEVVETEVVETEVVEQSIPSSRRRSAPLVENAAEAVPAGPPTVTGTPSTNAHDHPPASTSRASDHTGPAVDHPSRSDDPAPASSSRPSDVVGAAVDNPPESDDGDPGPSRRPAPAPPIAQMRREPDDEAHGSDRRRKRNRLDLDELPERKRFKRSPS
ncbi:MAG: hypothetical protein M1826_002160 [Phylliscum demangeonii]|nr:MAG: hypothetical protein M1826_002160 [Phylliscum demangeonii]